MAKTTDVPHEIRAFNKVFQELEYRHHAATIFDDYLSYCIYVFNTERNPADLERLKSSYGNQYECLVRMFHEHIAAMDKMLSTDTDWYDLLGTYYEVINSRSKSSAMGQFFTPSTLCDFMAIINGADESKGKGVTVNDPACGSGRTLLAWHAKAPGNYLFGDDIDSMCTKMCAVNFLLHGVVGQACNMDTLRMEYRYGYAINEKLTAFGEVSLRPITEEEANAQRWYLTKRGKIEREETIPEETQLEQVDIKFDGKGQGNFLSLFEC